MKVNEVAWENLKKQIEMHLKEDPNLTDIKINYQMKIPTFGTRNYLNLNFPSFFMIAIGTIVASWMYCRTIVILPHSAYLEFQLI